jgi:twinkle protein
LGIEKLSNVLEFFEYASKKDGAKHCILDSIMCTDVDVDSDKATVNNMMKTIIESLARSGSHYHIVAHCTKGNDEDYKEIPRVNTVKGIQEITARAHNVIFVWRNKPKEASIEGSLHKNQPEEARRKEREIPDTIIKVAKNRNGKVLGQIKAWFSFYSDRFRPEYEGTSDRPYYVCEDSGPD